MLKPKFKWKMNIYLLSLARLKFDFLNISAKYFPELVFVSADLLRWKHLTRCPTSGFLLTYRYKKWKNIWIHQQTPYQAREELLYILLTTKRFLVIKGFGVKNWKKRNCQTTSFHHNIKLMKATERCNIQVEIFFSPKHHYVLELSILFNVRGDKFFCLTLSYICVSKVKTTFLVQSALFWVSEAMKFWQCAVSRKWVLTSSQSWCAPLVPVLR